MIISNRRAALAGIFTSICILAAGCGDTSQPVRETGTQESTQGQQASDEKGNFTDGASGGVDSEKGNLADGNSADGNTGGADQGNTVSWLITESALPLPEDALTRDILKGDNWVAREKESHFWNGSFYRLSDLFEMVDEKNIFAGACIQVLAPPYG